MFAARLLEGAAQEELDLRVEAAQIVVRPALDGLQQGWINTKQERFTVGHDSPATRYQLLATGKSFPY